MLILKPSLLIYCRWLLLGPLCNAENSKELAIVLLPSHAINAESRRLNQQAASVLPGMRNLDNIQHITLYKGHYPVSHIADLHKAISDLNLKPFTVEMHPTLSNHENFHIRWQAKRSKELHDIHQTIVKAASPLRRGAIERMANGYSELHPRLQYQIDQYGSGWVLDMYDPHLTIYYGQARYHRIGSLAQELTPTLAPEQLQFKAQTIAIGELGYQGNMLNILHQLEVEG